MTEIHFWFEISTNQMIIIIIFSITIYPKLIKLILALETISV